MLEELYPNFPTVWSDQHLPLEEDISAVVTSMETFCNSRVCVSKYRSAGQSPPIFFLSSNKDSNLSGEDCMYYNAKCSKEQADMLRMFIALFNRSSTYNFIPVAKIFRALSSYITVFDNISLRIHVTMTDLNNLNTKPLAKEAKEYLYDEAPRKSYEEMTKEEQKTYDTACRQLIKFIVNAVTNQCGYKYTVLKYFNCCAERKMMMHCMDTMNNNLFNDFLLVTMYEPCDACSIMLNEFILAYDLPRISAYSLYKYTTDSKNTLVKDLESKFIMLGLRNSPDHD